MTRRAYRTSIPVDAVEVIESHYPDGTKRTASYFVRDALVGRREWFPNGHLEFETAFRNGVRHGDEYRFYENGQLLDKEPYRNGRSHGLGKQWAEDGRLLVTWKLTNGVGLDLWCTESGTLAEEHYWPAEGELGYTRVWTGDDRTIYWEYFYVRGKGYHGIWREWNEQGRMRRGFPRYFVANERVTKRQYLKACESDSTLPPYHPEHDEPARELPREYLVQKRHRH